MVETLEAPSAANSLKNFAHSSLVAAESGTALAAKSVGEAFAKTVEQGFAVTVAVGATAAFTQWDYATARDNIRRQYEMELSAQSGKPYNDLTNKDLDKLGEKNVVINDALKRAKWKRNLGLVAGTLAAGAALFAGGYIALAAGGALNVLLPAAAGAVPSLLPSVVGTVWGALTGSAATAATASSVGMSTAAFAGKVALAGAASAATAVTAFIATEKTTDVIAEKIFHHKEPSIRKVTHNPGLQNQLSPSSQVNYLTHLQKRVNPKKPQTFISQEQVFNVFLAAQPQMAAQIEGQFGKKFSALAPEQRLQILADVNGKSINLEQITSDLNQGHIRAQELAFLVQGQTSGVPRREGAPTTRMERAHHHIEEKLAQAQAEIQNLKQRFMGSKSTQLGGVMQNDMPVAMDKVGINAKGQPEIVDAAPQIGPAQQRELARRQAAAQGATARA